MYKTELVWIDGKLQQNPNRPRNWDVFDVEEYEGSDSEDDDWF